MSRAKALPTRRGERPTRKTSREKGITQREQAYRCGINDSPKRLGDTEIAADKRAMLEIYHREGLAGVFRLGAEQLSK